MWYVCLFAFFLEQIVSVVDYFVLLTLFVGCPSLSAVIGYSAWKGRLVGFSWKTFLKIGLLANALGAILLIYAQRLGADIRSLQYVWQVLCVVVSAALFGIAGGCVLGIFVYWLRWLRATRRGAPSGPPSETA